MASLDDILTLALDCQFGHHEAFLRNFLNSDGAGWMAE